jgi:HSP20 family protein
MNLLKKSSLPERTTWPSTHPFHRFFGNDFLDFWDGNSALTVPSINVREEKDFYEVEMAAPGMAKEDFDIDLDGNLLTISAEKEEENPKENDGGKRYSRREYNYSSFSRSFTLPEVADTEKIDASYKDGILHLRVPKKAEAIKNKNRKINVK